MGNMSYCRMENTLTDLRECFEYWDDAKSENEIKARKRIYNLCKKIVETIDIED